MLAASKPIAFLHGRPGPHPIHRAFAEAVGASFHYVDFAARWHDIPLPAAIRYWRWAWNAFRFPYRRYRAVLVEGPHVWPPFGGKAYGVPTFSLVDNETLYFLQAGFYKKRVKWGLLQALRRYDALLVIGEMQAQLAHHLLGKRCPPVYVGFNGVAEERLEAFRKLRPSLEVPIVLFIGHGGASWRTYYKGLDLFVEVMARLRAHLPHVEGWVVGRWAEAEQEALLRRYPEAPVRFLGPTEQIQGILGQAALYFHPGRGEAYGIAVLEAMAAGVPAMVSEWTGAREAVQRVWPEGVLPLSAQAMTQAILRYFALPLAERRAIGERSRTLVHTHYTASQAIQRFQAIFHQALAAYEA
ncbi:MAG: glycosyltransferase [Bacteroidetes bacterium]|nr:MAG: glycosyltransferase [Bacteroidota bacterium]